MNGSLVCLDSDVVMSEEASPGSVALWTRWDGEGTQVVAPPLFWYEVTSVLRNRVHRGSYTPEEGREALDVMLGLNIAPVDWPGLHRGAWDMAERFGLPTAYDAHYLVVAEYVGCEFWIGGGRLQCAVAGLLPWVRSLREA